MPTNKKVLLIILDGWGIAKNKAFSAIDKAKTPFIDYCIKNYPNATITTFGNKVGLPDGQMGNSEVGHIHLGAGRVVFQNLEKINQACKNNTLKENKILQEAISYCKTNKKALHLTGLASNGGVHSHIDHLVELIRVIESSQLAETYIHAFTDGRDCSPKSGLGFIKKIESELSSCKNIKLASVIGRFFAMDRDKRWERVKKAYDLVTNAIGKKTNSFTNEIENSYNKNVTDEFLEPLWNSDLKETEGKIKPGDAVLFFNFRTDRGRELTSVLSQNSIPDENMEPVKGLHFVTMTRYDENFRNISVMFDEEPLRNTLGEVLETNDKKQLRIAETEKYPHVTFFFSGGKEKPFNGEKRILCQSPRDVATYDLKPEMAAYKIKDSVIQEIKNSTADFICLNFANADMVGHTGVFPAAQKACEVVDDCTKEICKEALNNEYDVIILADHGNADVMLNDDGSENTQHSTNPVPFIVLSNKNDYLLKDGSLGDIAPTILKMMDIEIPKEMTGKILIHTA